MAEAVADADGAIGAWLHALARELWPLNRSITGAELRQTLLSTYVCHPSMANNEQSSCPRPSAPSPTRAQLGPPKITFVHFVEQT